MSDKYNPLFNRDKQGSFNKNKNFVSVVSGTDAYITEDEFNEMQWIKNNQINKYLNEKYHSGIFSKQDGDLICQNNDNFKTNLLSFKEMQILLKGYIINISGNNGNLPKSDVIKKPNINNVLLPPPPSSGSRDDFVYLEVWFKEIKHSDKIWFNGNKNNYHGIIENDMFDKRINGETCRRVQLQWKIKSIKGINFEKNPNGFNNKIKDGNVKAQGGKAVKSNYSFWRSDLNLDNNNNFNDKGLWVAGQGEEGDMQTIDGYSYAIPLFRIKRYNSGKYNEFNLNGASLFNSENNIISDRPDGRFSNIIYEDNIDDLRSNINPDNLKNDLNRNFNKLMNGKLKSKKNHNKIIKEYLGIPPIIPDSNTEAYINCNGNINNQAKEVAPHENSNKDFEYVPGFSGDGIKLKNDGYLVYDINSTLKSGYVTLMLRLQDSKNKELWSLKDMKSNIVLKCEIIKGNIVISDLDGEIDRVNLKELNIKINEVNHLAISWSKDQNKMYIISNDKVITSFDISERLRDPEVVWYFILGNTENSYNCNNIILDEIEYKKELSKSFGMIPNDLKEDNVKLTIDTQKDRRMYLKSNNKTTITQQVETISNSNGEVSFTIKAPSGGIFTNKNPLLLHDNEAVESNVVWSGLGTDTLSASIDNLGNNVEYNFMIIYEVNFMLNQGLTYLLKKVYKMTFEEYEDDFYSIKNNKNIEKHPITNLKSLDNNLNYIDDKIVVHNPNKDIIGFGCSIMYHIKGNGSNEITIPNKIYGRKIISIYNATCNKNNLLNQSILKDYEINDNDINITLNKSINQDKTIILLLGTTLPSIMYNFGKGGIEELTQVNKVEFIGDGNKKIFTKRFDTKIKNSLKGYLNNEIDYIAYVDGKPVEIDVEFNGPFVKFIFNNPPQNKTNILVYINRQYDPVRSERGIIWYEGIQYQGINDKQYIKSFNDKNIVEHLNSIYTFTEGFKQYNVNNKTDVNCIYLPSKEPYEYKIEEKELFNKATNLKTKINYALSSNLDINGTMMELNKINININDKLSLRGISGDISINNKILGSTLNILSNNHICAIPLLLKDNNDQLKMAVITTYLTNNKIEIQPNNQNTVIDIFNLDENILLK
jgi:hypothetical protein